MRIIQNNNNNNIKENNNIEYICEHCNSVFEYDEYDICTDNIGADYVKCPCCNGRCYVNNIPVTKENISFPESFYQFGVHKGSVRIDNKEITFWVKDCIDWLEKNPNESFKFHSSGDTHVCVFNHEDEYYIIVAKNYFDATIDK